MLCIEERSYKATAHLSCQPEGEPPPPLYQKLSPTTVYPNHGRCWDCTTDSTFGTRRCTCLQSDHLCTNHNCISHYKQRTPSSPSDHPPGATLSEHRNFSMNMTLAPSNFLNQPQQSFNDPKIMAEDVFKANMKIISYFGDVVHQNNITHLDIGIQYGREWQHWRYYIDTK